MSQVFGIGRGRDVDVRLNCLFKPCVKLECRRDFFFYNSFIFSLASCPFFHCFLLMRLV